MATYKKNIEVFPIQFQKRLYRKTFEEIKYFNCKVVNNDLEASYNHLCSLKLVPEYFKLTLRNPLMFIKKIPQQNWGYSINVKGITSVDEYLIKQFKSKKRSIIKRYVNRLEACLNIKYKLYYGHIEHDQYLFLMNCLKKMITRRFHQINETHKNLSEWSYLEKSTYNKILSKEASLFVIFNEEEPIEISLNYHFDKILFSYVSSFDIDYAKFGLGHIEIYKQIDWCIKNEYTLFEMGVGGTDYKRRWSNNTYQYYHYFIYSKKKRLIALILYGFYSSKEYLKSKGLNQLVPNLLFFFRKQNNDSLDPKIEVGPLLLKTTLPSNRLKTQSKQSILSKEYTWLKNKALDFSYATTTTFKDIIVFKINEYEYILTSKNHFQGITILRNRNKHNPKKINIT